MSLVRPVFAEERVRLRVTAVIVLYRMAPEESAAFRSVMASRALLNEETGDVRVLLWDNSPETPTTRPRRNLPEGVHYFADEANSGLARAYNFALQWAAEAGSEWLLTLDQDTAVPAEFFERMAAAARASTRYAGIGAIVPQIAAGGRQLSPNYFQFGAIPRWFRGGFTGVPRQPVFAFNSGAMLRVTALKQVGGYDRRFWLDDSDAMIFSRLHEHGKRVYVAGAVQVEHEFSMKDMQRRMSPERYRNALLAEAAFWDLRMNRAAGWERTLRLMLRLVKQRLRKDSADLRRITWQALMRRLFTSRRRRIEEWMQATANRVIAEAGTREAGELTASACMAAYNGGAFVEAQLQSILSQLKAADQVVIVDDGSTDDTIGRIAGVEDPRVRVLRHERNLGVVATFEDALRSATGDIVFLCDDDDVWAPTKAGRFLEVFRGRPDVQIVTSRVRMIDEDGQILADSRINREGKFLPGFWRNVFRNHYQGSAMAIRASLLGGVLPFPARRSFLHDAWIGTRNELLGGKAVFVNEDLLFYRRHSNNASRTKSLLRQIQTRIDLLLAHLEYAFRLQKNSSVENRDTHPANEKLFAGTRDLGHPAHSARIALGAPRYVISLDEEKGEDQVVPATRDRVAVIIPTFNAARYWPALSDGIRAQSLMPERVIVIDSSSSDGTAGLARRDGFDVMEIAASEFNHGATRQLGAEYAADANVLIYLTQDAVPHEADAFANLVRAFADTEIGAAYGRQLPRENASAIESHGRLFSYGETSTVRSWASRNVTGFKSIFFSNAFGAYRREALMSVGGFSPNVIFGEDTLVVARMHRAGWKTAYMADAMVRHSHSYSIAEEFRRYFDIGVLHARESWLIEQFGSASGEGRRFVVSELKYLAKHGPQHVPSALARTIAKYAGYKVGRRESRIAPGLKYRLGLNRQYWIR